MNIIELRSRQEITIDILHDMLRRNDRKKSTLRPRHKQEIGLNQVCDRVANEKLEYSTFFSNRNYYFCTLCLLPLTGIQPFYFQRHYNDRQNHNRPDF